MAFGVIDKLENDSLKTLLLSWNDIFEDYKEEESKQFDFNVDELTGYERENIPIRNRRLNEKLQFYKELFSEEDINNARRIAYQDLHYQNLLIENHFFLVEQIFEGQNVEKTSDQIINLLNRDSIKK